MNNTPLVKSYLERKFIYSVFVGFSVLLCLGATTGPISTFIRTVLDDADAATARATLGVPAANAGSVTNLNLYGTTYWDYFVGAGQTNQLLYVDINGNLDSINSGTEGQVLLSRGDTLAPGWYNLTSGVFSVSGTANRISVSPTTGDAVVDIDAAYVGQSSIGYVGTITNGTWNGTDIAWTNLAVGTANHVLRTDSTGQIISEAALSITNGGTGVDLTAASEYGLVYKHASAQLAVSDTITGIVYVAASSPPAAMTGTANKIAKFQAASPFIADSGISDDGTVTTIANPILYKRSVAAKTAAYNVLAGDSGKVFTNEGAEAAVSFNLPTAAAGLEYYFIVQDTDGVTLDAAAGDTLRIADTVSAADGTAASVTKGDVAHVISINATEWILMPIIGTWVIN